MPGDLRSARVYFSVLGSDAEWDEALAALDRASGFLRGEVGRRCSLRYAPELHFFSDRSLERGARIEEILARTRAASGPIEEPPEVEGEGDGGDKGPER